MQFKIPKPAFNKEYFLFLVPFFFVWHGFIENYVSVTTTEALLLFADYILAFALLFFLFYFLFRSWRKTSVFIFLLMAYYFFFGAMHDFAKSVIGESFFVKYSFILPFSLVFFIASFILIRRTKSGYNKLTRFLNILFVVLVLVDVPLLVSTLNNKDKKEQLQMGLTVCDSCNKPDIFLIVADEYAGNRELKEMFGFDNSGFENELKARGFHVVSDPKSNYDFTPFSTASMLSMNFLQNIEGRNSSKKDMNTCFGLINHNNLWEFFLLNGYRIVNNSIFHVNDRPTRVPQGLLFMGKRLITSQTFISRFNVDVRFNLVTRFKIRSEIRRITYYQQRSNEKIMEKLREESKPGDQPKFVYTHLLMPHYPYYNDSNGRERNLDFLADITNYRNPDAYIEYLQYSNKVFIELVDHILANSKKPPVIILMSDHGYRLFNEDVDKSYRFMNFNSILLPSKNYSGFYTGMTNINQFRTLLNTEFGQKLPMLKDSTSLLKE